MSKEQTKVTFEDVATGRIITISITPDTDENWDVSFDFGEGGLSAHEEGGLHLGLCNEFCETLGIFNNEEE